MKNFCAAIRAVCASALLLSALASAPAHATGDTPEDKLTTGFNAFLKDGAEAATTAWLQDGPYEGDAQLPATLKDGFAKAEKQMGKPESFELVREMNVSPRTRVIFAILYYPKGEEFFLFQMYRQRDGEWLVTNMEVNNHIFEVIPKELLWGGTK